MNALFGENADTLLYKFWHKTLKSTKGDLIYLKEPTKSQFLLYLSGPDELGDEPK